MGRDKNHEDWMLDEQYSVQQVAERVSEISTTASSP